MKKLICYKLLGLLLLVMDCHAGRYLEPCKFEGQEEVLHNGGSVLVSDKLNSAVLYQVSESIVDNVANFYFIVSNRSDKKFDFYFSNLKVEDQFGRKIRVVSKKELINDKKTSRNWQIFGSALCSGIEGMNASNAGRIDYATHTSSNVHSNFGVHSSNGWASGSANGYANSTTVGTVHCEALRQQAFQQAQYNADCRNSAIQNNYAQWEYGLSNFYFDSTTVFPSESYESNF